MSTLESIIRYGLPTRAIEDDRPWGSLQIFNCYRLVIALTLLILNHNFSTSFMTICVAYFIFGGVSIASNYLRIPSFNTQLFSQLTIDVLVLLVLMQLGQSSALGLGVLISIVIVGSSILSEGRTSLFFASLACVGLIIQQLYAGIFNSFVFLDSFQVLILGVSFFATAMLGYVLSKRVRVSETAAVRHHADVLRLQKLNEHIVQHLQYGVMVVSDTGNVQVINEAARQMLKKDSPINLIDDAHTSLSERFWAWRIGDNNSETNLISLENGAQLQTRFKSLSEGEGTLIFLEDTMVVAHKAQQMKLASLGRFTASMAHELRNPLGAISHAVQLLEESSGIEQSDRRLAEIIHQHCDRMNIVIKNILQLSRRRESFPIAIHLKDWLDGFLQDFHMEEFAETKITIGQDNEIDTVSFDPSQLRQILANLCENGIRYSHAKTGEPSLQLVIGKNKETHENYMDVIDQGEGVKADNVTKLFEPFFTTERKGTGLGLYIAYELCQANQAQLEYVNKYQGGCFRIIFKDEGATS